ncbi:MAG: DUF3127 domain-containing protein [Prolixibacteraceae bacterium]|nr:DUF3127 domain-containing protein [Prolixibacteraceae bacterium]
MDVKGRVDQILPIQTGTSKAGKEWSKQEFIIETEEQFPKKICFTLFGDKSSLLNGISANDQVEVFFNLESREYNGRWYHNINAWRINPVQAGAADGPDFTPGDIPPPAAAAEGGEAPVDDLPF